MNVLGQVVENREEEDVIVMYKYYGIEKDFILTPKETRVIPADARVFDSRLRESSRPGTVQVRRLVEREIL